MKLLDIIIPFYNQKEEYIIRAISSIIKGINEDDYNIILINDGGIGLSQEFLNKYDKKIMYYSYDKNVGAGMARQYGISVSSSEYITFLDSDDEFISENLNEVIDCLKNKKPNVLFTDILQEFKNNGVITTKVKTKDDFFSLHGVFINRDYLITNNYSFHKELRLYEDFYFCNVLFLSSRCNHLHINTYLWKYNDNSLTLKNGDDIYFTSNISDHYISVKDGYKELKKRKSVAAVDYLVYGIYSMYFVLESNFFAKAIHNDLRNKYEKKLYELIDRNSEAISKLPKDRNNYNYQAVKNGYLISHPELNVLISYDEFLLKMKKKYR